MRPVYQTIFGPPNGDCFSACMASVLEMRLADVPNYIWKSSEQWQQRWFDWLYARGLGMVFCDPAVIAKPAGYSILTGASPRGDWNHSVVALDGRIVWDPSPGPQRFILRDRQEYVLFQALDPSVVIRAEAVEARRVRVDAGLITDAPTKQPCTSDDDRNK